MIDLYPDETGTYIPRPLPPLPQHLAALDALPPEQGPQAPWEGGPNPTYGGGYPYPHVQPVQGFRDRLALALSQLNLEVPSMTRPGQLSNVGAGFLTGAVKGFAANGMNRIGAREKLNQALGQAAHEENGRNIEASKAAAAEKARIADDERQIAGQKSVIDYRNTHPAPETPNQGTDETSRFLAMTPEKQQAFLSAKTKLNPPSNPDSPEEWKNAADDIIAGLQPPVLTGYGRSGKAISWIRSYFHQKGFNYSKAVTEWSGLQALTRNANTGQMAALQRSGATVDQALGNLNAIMQEAGTQIPRTLLPSLNRFTIGAAEQGAYGPAGQQIAAKLRTQFGILQQEIPTVLNGGYAPDESARKTTHEMLSRFDSDPGLAGTLQTLRENVGYKTNAIKSLGVTVPGLGAPTSMPWLTQSPQGPAAAPEPTVPPKSAAPANTVLMTDPDGNQFHVPVGQKNQSIAHGWKLVKVK